VLLLFNTDEENDEIGCLPLLPLLQVVLVDVSGGGAEGGRGDGGHPICSCNSSLLISLFANSVIVGTSSFESLIKFVSNSGKLNICNKWFAFIIVA
jgi:hypothetical protein